MTTRILAALTLCLLLGCGRETSGPTTNSTSGAPQAAGEAGGGEDAATAALLLQLTQGVRKYAAEQRRVPQSLQDLVTSGMLPALPTPPPGKKFAINKNLEVYLTK